MERTPEPELMNEPEQVRAYAAADFREPNGQFCDQLASRLGPLPSPAQVLDLGCGPADIVWHLAARFPTWRFVAVDGAEAMLARARIHLVEKRLEDRVELRCARIQELDWHREFQVILSNSLLHHLPDPTALWSAVRAAAVPGAAVAVMDLARPASPTAARELVQLHAASEAAILQRDFYNSLCAAFTVAEVRRQLDASGLSELRVAMVSDRHLFAWGRVNHEIDPGPAASPVR